MSEKQAVIHSLNGTFDWVQIIKKLDESHYIAWLYKTFLNPVNGYFYVDDKYGEIAMF